MPKSASAAIVKATSKTKRPMIVFGVRHCCGMEERKAGILMLLVVSCQVSRLGLLLSPVSADCRLCKYRGNGVT